MSFLEAPDHRILHGQLAAVAIAKNAAEARANELLPKIGRQRNSTVLRLADSKAGRTLIGGSLERFYKYSSSKWWNRGTPSIGTVFPDEKNAYISKRANTSLGQDCMRP